MKKAVVFAVVLTVATVLLGSGFAFASAAGAAASLGYSAAPPMPYGQVQPPVRVYKPAPRHLPKRAR